MDIDYAKKIISTYQGQGILFHTFHAIEHPLPEGKFYTKDLEVGRIVSATIFNNEETVGSTQFSYCSPLDLKAKTFSHVVGKAYALLRLHSWAAIMFKHQSKYLTDTLKDLIIEDGFDRMEVPWMVKYKIDAVNKLV